MGTPLNCNEKIAIVGGGIAGLFCAYILARKNKEVFLFEASGRYGGRINTIRLNKQNKRIEGKWNSEELEFFAEFGPMRVELDKQLLLKALLTYLGIKAKPMSTEPGTGAYLVSFSPYASPDSIHDAQYELRESEVGKTLLQLLRLALLRIIAHLEVKEDESGFMTRKDELIRAITLAAATQEPVEPIFAEWVKKLSENNYWDIQRLGEVKGVPLHAMGFWNLLSDYLSHNAITKLRDLGTFYHLLPENPNAAEWLVWWLRGLAISEQLQGIFGGMECIVDNLLGKFEDQNIKPRLKLFKNCQVAKLERVGSKLKLIFDPKHSNDDLAQQINALNEKEYDRVILALPKSALEKIAHQSLEVFNQEEKITELLDSTFGFPMVKAFVVVKNRWWEKENRANQYATRVPTRELHYWKGCTKESKQGLIRVYTDRPASSFWANYVMPGPQQDVAQTADKTLPEKLQERLIKKIVQYINENDLPDITPEDIVWCGFRDWGREPYGGANHAWRPERMYWVVMSRLSCIPVDNSGRTSIHICGEAYSDYHGFMEGALRSAVYVLHRILDGNSKEPSTALSWLNDSGTGVGLPVEENYLETLRSWVIALDRVKPDDSHLYTEEMASK